MFCYCEKIGFSYREIQIRKKGDFRVFLFLEAVVDIKVYHRPLTYSPLAILTFMSAYSVLTNASAWIWFLECTIGKFRGRRAFMMFNLKAILHLTKL